MKSETTAAYRLAYTFPLFEHSDKNGLIKACIIGSGAFFEEYLKAAVWSTQRDGYRLELDVFTTQSECERLSNGYPEVFHTEGLSDRDEIFYDVRLHSGEPFGEYGFALTTGNDFGKARADKTLVITEDSCDRKNDRVYLSLNELCAADFFKESGIEKQALSLFCGFGKSEAQFYENEFSYRSSVASALFWDIRRRQSESLEVCEQNMKLEHHRWNAFTRTEGYRYGGVRNDTEKTHPCLVAWNMLDSAYQQYDANPIINARLFL